MRFLGPSGPARAARAVAATLAGLMLCGPAALPAYAGSAEAAVSADQPTVTADPDPGTPAEIAQDTLAAAEDLVEGDSTADPTLVLNDLSQSLPDLPADDRRAAREILARPTAGGANDGILEYDVAEAEPVCGTNVCVHYVASTSDRPPMTDTAPDDGIPDWVQETADVMEHVWAREIGSLGYRRPLADGGTPANATGPTTGLDVFLGDIGDDGLYGYATTDGTARRSSAYLVLDDDYSSRQFGTSKSPGQLMRVTAAHEFFHTVQFGYDAHEDGWFMEATATWMEERVYDSVNDNRQFLSASSMALPGRSLDSPAAGTPYGNWIFFEFLSRRLGGAVVKSMWSRAAESGVYSTVAISRALRAEDTSLRTRFAGFSASNLAPARTYSEGETYRRPRVSRTYQLTSATPATGARRLRLDHLTSRSYAFTAGASLTGSRRIRLTVNGPSAISGAVATVSRRDGTLSRHTVPLNGHGNGSSTLPLSRSSVKRVTLTLSNSSVRYVCNRGSYSCNGDPRDQNKPFTFSARAVR
jgi:hypothetical protein